MPTSLANANHNIVAFALSQRLRRVERIPDAPQRPGGWVVWLDTNDYVHGTYLMLYDSGMIDRFTVREDEGDDVVTVRPSDAEIYGDV